MNTLNKNYAKIDIDRYNQLLEKEKILFENAKNILVSYNPQYIQNYDSSFKYDPILGSVHVNIYYFHNAEIEAKLNQIIEKSNLDKKNFENLKKELEKENTSLRIENNKLKNQLDSFHNKKPWYKF